MKFLNATRIIMLQEKRLYSMYSHNQRRQLIKDSFRYAITMINVNRALLNAGTGACAMVNYQRSGSGLSNCLDRSIDRSARCRAHSNHGGSKISVLIKRSTSDASAISKQTEPRNAENPPLKEIITE